MSATIGAPNATNGAPAARWNLIRASVRNRQIVFVLTALLVIVGLRALVGMPRREDPKITIRQGLVLAFYPGATAEQVEQQVTRPVEQKLFEYGEVRKDRTFTTTRPGVVVANVELNDDVRDPERFWSTLRHDFNELRVVGLPAGVQGPIVNSNFGDVVAVLLAVRGDRYTARELATYLDRIEDGVRTVPDVAKVRRWGEREEEIAVTASSARLAQYGVSTTQLAQALAARGGAAGGGTVKGGDEDVAVRPSATFGSTDEVRQLLVAGRSGAPPATVGDVAAVERRFGDPAFVTRVDGAESVLMSIEMREGRNIVRFGDALRAKLATLRAELPPDLTIDLIADQPEMVAHRVRDFGREFGIAVVAVVLVTVLLLPLRVAAIAAVAIPVTVAITVAALDALGIELHQISFAGLVVALGMVVDDAIVIADNYVELLDHGLTPTEAAWRSASDLAIPVLGATLTIVASFLPLALLLPGSVGEFIRALPLTVSVALVCSYVVAMLLTPVLCLAFIKTGLRATSIADRSTLNARASVERSAISVQNDSGARRWRPLDAMQALYERVMAVAMPRTALTLGTAAFAVAAGLLMLARVPQRFFPAAERNQFVIDVWMPEGTSVEATDATVRHLTAVARTAAGVRTVASFAGQGAPRFYYNVNPEAPASNYGQLVVNTRDAESTPEIAAELHEQLQRAEPGARVYVKELQQGAALGAPIELRFTGPDVATLAALGDTAAAVLATTPGSEYVDTDWHEPTYALGVHLRPEIAARVGVTEADVAQQLAAGLDGFPAAAAWEGGRRLAVRLRFDSAGRRSTADVGDAYITSPTTGARVPVRQIADVVPTWSAGRIVRRNGVRTITVRAFARPGELPSVVLADALPKVRAVPLPPGYALSLGGEVENQAEVQGPMSVALGVSLLGIFLILFLQFRNVRYPLIVMVSIPLALFGSALGLVLTHNPFGFTANLGLTALTGVVVRNAIILVDYILARLAEGEPLEQAALDAGRRRLRPIFLTTMAAAVGVVPLIVSGSSLWSPLASVLAVGLVCSMVFTLVVVPVLFVAVEKRRAGSVQRAAVSVPHSVPVLATGVAALVIFMSAAAVAGAQPPVDTTGTTLNAARWTLPALPSADRSTLAAPKVLSLDDAVVLALHDGRATRIARERVREKDGLARAARSDYFPRLTVEGNWQGGGGTQSFTIGQGALGDDAGGKPLPATDRTLTLDAGSIYYGYVTLAQPVTQLLRIRAGDRAARWASREADADRRATELDVALGVEKLYLAALAAERRREAAAATLAAREAQQVDADRGVAAGFALAVRAAEARAAVLDAEQALLVADGARDDAEVDLSELLGLPATTRFALSAPAPDASLVDTDAYVNAALAASPTVLAARAQVEQVRQQEGTARSAYVPDIAVFGRYTRQNVVTFVGHDLWTGGVQASWTAFDFGRRRGELDAAGARRRAAEENAARVSEHVRASVIKAYRAAERAQRLEAVARAALAAREAAERVAGDQAGAGLALASYRRDAAAQRAAADATVFEAAVAARIARAELRRVVGTGASVQGAAVSVQGTAFSVQGRNALAR